MFIVYTIYTIDWVMDPHKPPRVIIPYYQAIVDIFGAYLESWTDGQTQLAMVNTRYQDQMEQGEGVNLPSDNP